METIMAATPEKSAPVTKKGPKMVSCHIGFGSIEKMKETTVWTDTATGITATESRNMDLSYCSHCLFVPWKPKARISYTHLPLFNRSLTWAMSGIIAT